MFKLTAVIVVILVAFGGGIVLQSNTNLFPLSTQTDVAEVTYEDSFLLPAPPIASEEFKETIEITSSRRQPTGHYYLIQPGETIEIIADKFGTTAPRIWNANRLPFNSRMLAGQRVWIPFN